MTENIPIAIQVLLAVVAILTVIGSFMQTNSVRNEWSARSKTYSARELGLTKKIEAQDKKIEDISERLTGFATEGYVDNKLDSFDVIATERYNSLKEDQHTMQRTLTGIEQLLTDERTRKLDSQASEIADLQKQLRDNS